MHLRTLVQSYYAVVDEKGFTQSEEVTPPRPVHPFNAGNCAGIYDAVVAQMAQLEADLQKGGADGAPEGAAPAPTGA